MSDSRTIIRKLGSRGCNGCRFAYQAPPKFNHLCAHPTMIRAFDVTAFVKRAERPQRCPMEVLK